MQPEYETSVEEAILENGQPAIRLKLSGGTVEVNVWLSADEASALAQVSDLSEDSRGLRLGRCANSQVHWSRDRNGKYYLLIGHDDETWDVGVVLSELTFSQILGEIAR